MKIMTLIGGISTNSLNRRFFGAVEQLDGTQLIFSVLDIARLPFYSQDLEADPPAAVVELREMAASSRGVLIVTPEYNRSIPGVLKNALDWGSRPPEGNVWRGKPTAIMGASTGTIGTFGAQQHLRGICSFLDMPVMNQPTIYCNASVWMVATSAVTSAAGGASSDARDTFSAAGNRLTARSEEPSRLTERSEAAVRTFLAAFEEWIARFS